MRRVLLSLALLATACGSDNSYRNASVSSQTGDSAAMLDFSGGISIPEGSAASAHIDLVSHSNKNLGGGDIQSADATVLRVLHTPDDASRYVFLGVRTGTTQVHVLVNGQQVQTLSATVVAPPASSFPATIDAGAPSVGISDASAPDADAALATD